MIFNDPDAGPPKELTQLLGVYQEVKGFIKKRLAFLVEKQKKYEQERYVENPDGILVSRKLLNREGIINCPVCGRKTKTVDDDIYINKYECCSKCFIQYVDGREERWLNGWRPKNVAKSS